jgi:hypothetical protein
LELDISRQLLLPFDWIEIPARLVGNEEYIEEGKFVGGDDRKTVGVLVGKVVGGGDDVGDVDGELDGEVDGALVGRFEPMLVGIDESAVDGIPVGDGDGNFVDANICLQY